MQAMAKAGDLARILGLSVTQIHALSKRGIIVKSRCGEFALEESIRAYCAHLREFASGRPAATGSGGERAKLVAAALELKTARQRGALVDAETVAKEWEVICRTIRAGMLRIPRRAAGRLPHLTPQDVRALDAQIRAVLTELVT
jgi:phage terminase Nu1 subunit (DNA packaging protein)